jgi:hypothetical protein
MVLFFNLKCWETVFPILANIARQLEQRGIPTHHILCSPGWKCDALRPIKSDPPDCPWGREKLESGFNGSGLAFSSAGEYADPELRERCEKIAKVLSEESRPAYNGILLEEVIKASLGRYLRGRYDPAKENHRAARRAFLTDSLGWIETANIIFEHHQPEAIVIWGGTFYAERILAILARRRGIPVFAVENTAFRDRIYFEPEGVTGNRHRAAHNWHWLEARALTPLEKQKLSHYLAEVQQGVASSMPQPPPLSRREICEFLGINPNKKLVLLLGQVAIDSVVLLDSPVFPDMADFIRATAELFSRHPDYQLIVRLHPAEAMWQDNLTFKKLQGWTPPENCSLVHSQQLNTYDLMRESELGLTLCSQAGLEMLSLGKPVVVAGQAFYAGKGFTFDVPNRACYPAVLEAALNSTLSPTQRESVEKLLYYIIFEQLIPFDRETLRVTEAGMEMIAGHLGLNCAPASIDHSGPLEAWTASQNPKTSDPKITYSQS